MRVKDLNIENYNTLVKETEVDMLTGKTALVCVWEELILLKYPHHAKQSVYSMQFSPKLW